MFTFCIMRKYCEIIVEYALEYKFNKSLRLQSTRPGYDLFLWQDKVFHRLELYIYQHSLD